MNINTKALKEKALSFPEPVKSLILSEPDIMDSTVFVEKLGTWERLLAMERDKK